MHHLALGAATAPDLLNSALDTLRVVLEYVGTVAFAISGAVAASRRRMDLVGAVVLACLVAVGGGTARDLLLDRPVFWMENPTLVLVAVATALVIASLYRRRSMDALARHRIVEGSDAAGMAIFVVIGTSISLELGVNPVAAVIVGVVNGVGGGVLRDLFAAQVPEVFWNGQLYATAALAGAALYAALHAAHAAVQVTFWLPLLVIVALRVLSLTLGWGVPTVAVVKKRERQTEDHA
ncbi:TRIC cation channel family protein [Demequina sp. TTPB684]|uniref:trimeric intracellular cation channel family protein n=1 Tax=unclassified Demequina TaxID=2620311 RepID=UPI001CF4840A|nr:MULTISPECIES: TRIC cation channel family protein [unclassified Demequina]MCB2412699.1 TRIC cation channel family protein [Demequina sp. TTPB684]UPU87662.1 TRIC cation channel family protein [Demequina sp. TMPB413]